MSLALLVTSPAGLLEGIPAEAQTLIFPYKDSVELYHRISNGSKGRGQTWNKVTEYDLPHTDLKVEPVAVALNDRDLQMVELGLVTNIAVKALYARESATPITAPSTHSEAVINIIGSLFAGDQSLTAYITDKRRTNGVTINPISRTTEQGVLPTIADSVVTAPVVATYEEVEVATNDNRVSELALSMITIPDPKWAREYVHRNFGGKTDWDIFDRALADGDNVLIEGGAGSGKTIAVQSYASARGYRYFNVSNNNGIDPSQLFGRWIPRADGQGYRWQDGAVTELVRNGGVLLLNEVNFLPTRVSTVLFSLLDYRREIQLLENGGEVIKAHKDLLIVADMNYGYRGTQELNQAFNDRFGIKLEFPYDKAIEKKVVGNASLLVLADKLRDQFEKDEITTPISTRSLVQYVKNAKRFGIDFASTSFVNGFNKEERSAVRLSVDTFKDNIASELNISIPTHPDTDRYRVETI